MFTNKNMLILHLAYPLLIGGRFIDWHLCSVPSRAAIVGKEEMRRQLHLTVKKLRPWRRRRQCQSPTIVIIFEDIRSAVSNVLIWSIL